ncbi:MAG: hypothetical protein WKF42_01145 [Solirubrobacteraceae bacterium]
MNRPTLRALLALACCCALFAACGNSEEPDATAASTLEQTVAATSKIDNGRLSASIGLQPEGMLALAGAITLRAAGPFASPAAGELPRLRLALAASLAGQSIDATASSTGKRGFLRLGGRDYELDDEFLDALREELAGKQGGGFALLGLDPTAWIKDPRNRGEAKVGGEDTIRIAGQIDVERLLADLAELLDGGSNGDGLLTPKLRRQIAAAVTSAKVDVWSGAQDKVLRQLAVVIDFAFDKGSSPIDGLDGGRVKLRLRLDDVGTTTFEVLAPQRPRPLSQLAGDGGLAALLGGLGAALPGGREGAGDGGAAFLRCVTAAAGDAAAVARCASKLAP